MLIRYCKRYDYRYYTDELNAKINDINIMTLSKNYIRNTHIHIELRTNSNNIIYTLGYTFGAEYYSYYSENENIYIRDNEIHINKDILEYSDNTIVYSNDKLRIEYKNNIVVAVDECINGIVKNKYDTKLNLMLKQLLMINH